MKTYFKNNKEYKFKVGDNGEFVVVLTKDYITINYNETFKTKNGRKKGDDITVEIKDKKLKLTGEKRKLFRKKAPVLSLLSSVRQEIIEKENKRLRNLGE